MSRRALLLGVLVAAAGCEPISLEGDAARPFACIPTSADGGVDAGKQCSDGWSCGFDQKCFNRDAGHAAQAWRCVVNDQCPSDWRCGAEVNEQRFCQRLDAGAPSPCNVPADCQGGWRCGFEHVCFDPAVPDGGSARRCLDDAALQCPLAFRCGEQVGDTALCLLLDAGTNAPCNTDQGCEGGFRCDTRAHVCIRLDDVAVPGALANLRALLISPLSNAPAPLHFAASGVAPSELFMGAPPAAVFASLDDAGVVRVIGQALNGDLAREQFRLSRPASEVRRLGVTTRGAFAFFANGSREEFLFGQDAGQSVGMNDTTTFVWEDTTRQGRLLAGKVKADTVELEGLPLFTFASPLLAATVWGDRLYAWTVDGGIAIKSLDVGVDDNFGGPGVVITPGTPVSVVSGLAGTTAMPPQTTPGFFLVTPQGYQPWVNYQSNWLTTPALQAPCAPMLQVSFGEDGPFPAAVVRCGAPDGGVLALKQSFEQRGGGMLVVKTASVIDDLVPYRDTVTNQTAASAVRAHAGANGRVWLATPQSPARVLGERPLRALVLDRQPDAIFWVRARGESALFAASGASIFSATPRNMLSLDLGFISEANPASVAPLQTFANRGRWIVVSSGILDVGTTNASPAVVALIPSTAQALTAPVSAFVTALDTAAGRREVVLLSSRDSIWAADVTGIYDDPFAQPAVLEPVLVPQPGVRLRSLTLTPTASGVGGFATTSTATLRFESGDLVRWSLSTVDAPDAGGLPVEVWTDGDAGRVGTANGTIWSLPIMVALTDSVRDGTGPLVASDFARLCGEQLVSTGRGVHRLVANPDGGRPTWAPLSALNAALDGIDGVRFFETAGATPDGGVRQQLYAATPSGQVVEVLGDGPCP